MVAPVLGVTDESGAADDLGAAEDPGASPAVGAPGTRVAQEAVEQTAARASRALTRGRLCTGRS
ncbi:hypothetical protein GCM10009634_20350 [Saccharothrix xinjiangensis]